MRRTGLAALLIGAAMLYPATLRALEPQNQTGIPSECLGDQNFTDPFCQGYTPTCNICEKTVSQPMGFCAQANNQDGTEDCSTVYYGGKSVSCTLSGVFCGNVTVH